MSEEESLLKESDFKGKKALEHPNYSNQEITSDASLASLPAEQIGIIAEFLSKKDKISLKKTSRRFYGENPDISCLYASKYSKETCNYISETPINFLMKELNDGVMEGICLACVSVCSNILAIPFSCLGGMVGCIMDRKNQCRRIQHPREQPEDGFIFLEPDTQRMK